jgi:hypothetical protein
VGQSSMMDLLNRIIDLHDEVQIEWGQTPTKFALHPETFNELKYNMPQEAQDAEGITLEPYPSKLSFFYGMQIHVSKFMPKNQVLFFSMNPDSQIVRSEFKELEPKPKPKVIPKSKRRRMIQI